MPKVTKLKWHSQDLNLGLSGSIICAFTAALFYKENGGSERLGDLFKVTELVVEV